MRRDFVRKLLLPIVLICLVQSAVLWGQTPEVAPLLENGPTENRVNLVFLSEGYRLEELDTFIAHADYFTDYLFEEEPFKEYQNAFNSYAVAVASNESGSDHPSLDIFKDTYFNSTYDSWGLSRGLTVPPNDHISDPSEGFGKARDLLDGILPEWDVIIFIVNDPMFGGWGDFRGVVTSIHGYSGEVFVHELGHALGGLGDEYSTPFPLDPYPVLEEPNTTQETRPEFIKWNAWIDPETPIPTPDSFQFRNAIGLFEGARYEEKGWFRPKRTCLMRASFYPFCEVCREALVLAVYRSIRPVDLLTPATEILDIEGNLPVPLEVQTIPLMSHDFHYQWWVDGVLMPGVEGSKLEIPVTELGNGGHHVELRVSDPTSFVRVDPEELLKEEVAWQLNISELTGADSRKAFFPRFEEEEGFFNGLALINHSGDPVSIQFTDLNGRSARETGQIALDLASGEQVARLSTELFSSKAEELGWILAESSEQGTAELFLSGNGETELDGGIPPALPSKNLYFPDIRQLDGHPVSNRILIGNLNPQTIEVRIRFWARGEVLEEEVVSIEPNDLLRRDGFGADTGSGSGFFEVTVEKGIGAVGWQLLRSEELQTRVIFNALNEPMKEGYSAQFAAEEGSILTRVDLLNIGEEPDEFVLKVFGEGGEVIVGPLTYQVPARSSLVFDSREVLEPERSTPIIGSLSVESKKGHLLGTVVFGDAGGDLEFAAGFSLESRPSNESILSHMADNSRIFTGIAVFNPGPDEALVELTTYDSSGEITGGTAMTLKGRSRFSKLIPELIPEVKGKVGGYIRITSTQPIVIQQLFGDRRLRYMASVPSSLLVSSAQLPDS